MRSCHHIASVIVSKLFTFQSYYQNGTKLGSNNQQVVTFKVCYFRTHSRWPTWRKLFTIDLVCVVYSMLYRVIWLQLHRGSQHVLYIWLEFSDVWMLEHYGNRGCHMWAGYAHPSGTPDITSRILLEFINNVHFLVFCVLYSILFVLILSICCPDCDFWIKCINSQNQLSGTNRQIHVQRIFILKTYNF